MGKVTRELVKMQISALTSGSDLADLGEEERLLSPGPQFEKPRLREGRAV